MAFDGLVTRSIVNELNKNLLNGKINKIFEPNKNELLVEIYNKQKYFLNICIDSSNCRINLTKYHKENPKTALNFCMLLRKYLIGSRITSIYTYNMDRIVIIKLENYNELNDLIHYNLVVELMGKHSNVILINTNNIIIDSMRHISSDIATRTILPANLYTFPTSNKESLLSTNFEKFEEIINKNANSDLISCISKYFEGINTSFMMYTMEKLNINNSDFTHSDLLNLYNYICNIINNDNNKLMFNEINLKNKKDYVISIEKEIINQESLNSYIDEFYYQKENNDSFINYRNTLLKLILSLLSKCNKKLIYIQEKLTECSKMDLCKLYGELITSNLYKINNNINISEIELENYYDDNKIIQIPLDSKYSPSFNAKLYFKKYNKLKNTFEIVSEQKKEIQIEIEYLESIIYSIESSLNIDELNEIHQEIEENILKNYSSKKTKINENNLEIDVLNIESYKVYVGKNNKQNDTITFRLSDKNDIWFHVQGFSGSHVLLKTNGIEIKETDSVILKCAKLAAIHSKASNENKVTVDYTLIKNIKKPKGAKPGFVIFNSYKSIIVDIKNG